MSWTLEQRQASRAKYARLYSGTHHQNGSPVIVPANVERVDTHEPCFACGIARGPCRHRRWAA